MRIRALMPLEIRGSGEAAASIAHGSDTRLRDLARAH